MKLSIKVFSCKSDQARRKLWIQSKSSCPEVFCKKGVLKNFAKFTGKHLCQSLFFNKKLWHRCLPVNFAKFLRTRFFYRTPPVAAFAVIFTDKILNGKLLFFVQC